MKSLKILSANNVIDLFNLFFYTRQANSNNRNLFFINFKYLLIVFCLTCFSLLVAAPKYSGPADFNNRSYVDWLFDNHEPFTNINEDISGIYQSSMSGAIKISRQGKGYHVDWFKIKQQERKIIVQKWHKGTLSWSVTNSQTGYKIDYIITELADAGLRIAWRNDHGKHGLHVYARQQEEDIFIDPIVSMAKKNQVDYKDKTTGMEFVLIPKDCFQMGDLFKEGVGSELHLHKVCLDSYYIGKYEVTQEQWLKVMGYNPSCNRKGGRFPVEQVSWQMANQFIDKLNALSNEKYRLPSEAQWEYACRDGGKKIRFGNGKNIARSNDINFDARSQMNNPYSRIVENGLWRNSTTKVGSFNPNSLGIFDLAGNVSEYTHDYYDNDYYQNSPEKNPLGPASGTHRSSRGGNWRETVNTQRCTSRNFVTPTYHQGYLKEVLAKTCAKSDLPRMFGFRLARAK